MFPDCLNGLVGIYEDTFGCSSIPEIDNVSSIGLFVTQDPSYNHCRFKAGDTSCDLANLFLQMRAEAYRQITTDLGAILADKIQTRTESVYFIGQNSTGRYLNNSSTITEIPTTPFIKIQTEYREGGFIEIQKIALMLQSINNTPVVVNLRVIKESTGETVKTYPITINASSTNPKPVVLLRLPCDGETYKVEYTYDSASFLVPDSQYHCGCGDKLKNALGFIKQQNGLNGAAVQAYGISLLVNVGCEIGSKICALIKNPDYRLVIGYMLRKKIIEFSLKSIFARQEVNRFTLLGEEDYDSLIISYAGEYNERLKWFMYQNQFEVDGFCLTCSGSGMRKVSLLTGR